MTTKKEARQHLYSRSPLDPNGNDSLAKIACQIVPGAVVLDIGCAVGELGRYLAEQKHCVVDGIEANPDAAAIARRFYRQVWEIDLEIASLADLLGESRYQYIVCADVLEHLRDPGQLLRQIANFLTPSGKLLVSIPNVGHLGVFLELLSGDFRYREEGLLDQTHLRFFTQRSFLRLLAENGFSGRVVDRTIIDLQHSEFSSIPIESISSSLLREMQSWDDSITYQFIVEAHPQEAGENVIPLISIDQSAPHGPRFACQVYWRSNDEPFTESRSQCVYLPVGMERQRVNFTFPKGLTHSLRFDPSDWKGFLRLYAMRLLDGAECLWTWDGNIETLLRGRLHSIFPAPLKTGEVGVVLSLLDEDPWLELPVPPELLSRAERLEVELSWPMSSDYLAVQGEWEDILKQNQRLATELESMQQISQV
ncbi:class I SAM-dependent methyltransferase, partial [Acidithiobacillus sp.]|uniref:class I SAM-dependent methyltransferase n=1 Tax=Acidithiobacillus sp. TaxID=1872118 RepID=UPI003D088B1B